MTDADVLAQAEAHIARLEEVVADYALRYGLSERARAVFGLCSARATVPAPASLPPTGPSDAPPACAALRLVEPTG